jgi:DNA (cytosine-5)-methyltransferase 3A
METVLNNFCAEGLCVLSLFDGMSCGQLALQKAGIKVKQYYAAEIDKYAIQVTQHNFPNTIQLGDVTKVKGADLPKIDLIIGGSPCQGFSFAGKGLNFEDERSKLFFEFVRLIKECKPKYFFLENVKMKKEHELVISQYMKVAPIEVNSALVSAQNRVRLYWTNINEKPYGLFDDMMADIPQPKDKGILLKDVLESEVAEKFYLSEKMLNYFKTRAANFNNGKVNIRNEEGKASAILASSASIDISDNFIKVDTDLKVSKNQDKANCFTAGGNSGGLHSDMTLIVASRGRNPENPKSRESGLETEQHLEPRFDGKTNCITSVAKDNLVMQLNGNTESGGKQPYQQNRVYDVNGISPALMAQMSCGTHAIMEGAKIRRLTPTECERLQTVPDGYTSCVSDTQRYRMLGNGWTVDVIAHFFVFLKGEEKKLFKTETEC